MGAPTRRLRDVFRPSPGSCRNGGAFPEKMVTTGNPVRPAIIEAAKIPYTVNLRILFNPRLVKQGVSISEESDPKVSMEGFGPRITQVRPEDMERCRTASSAGDGADIAHSSTTPGAHQTHGDLTVLALGRIGDLGLSVRRSRAHSRARPRSAPIRARVRRRRVITQSELSPEAVDYRRDDIAGKRAENGGGRRLSGKPDAANLLADG